MSEQEAEQKPAQMAFDDFVQEAGEETAAESEGTSVALFTNATVLTAEDVVIPRLRLMQGLSREVQDGSAKPGEWVLTGMPPTDEIHATVDAVAKYRRYLNSEDGSILCRSEDSVTGVGDPGGTCEACPLSKWVNSDTKGGKNIPPPCQSGYRYLLNVEGYGHVIYEMKRTAMNAAKALNGQILRTGYGTTKVIFRSQKATGGKGTYYSPIVIPTK